MDELFSKVLHWNPNFSESEKNDVLTEVCEKVNEIVPEIKLEVVDK